MSPTKEQARREADRKMQRYAVKQTKMSTPMESIQAQTEPIDDLDHLPYVIYMFKLMQELLKCSGQNCTQSSVQTVA